MMDDEHSALEKQLLREFLDMSGKDELPEDTIERDDGALFGDAPQQPVGDETEVQEKSGGAGEDEGTPPLIVENIHFLVDEIQESLNRDMEGIIFSLNHPLAGKNVEVLKAFVRHVIHTRAAQLKREDEAFRPSAQETPLQVQVERKTSSAQAISDHEGVIPPPPPCDGACANRDAGTCSRGATLSRPPPGV